MKKYIYISIGLIVLLTSYTDHLFSSGYKGDRFWYMRPSSARTAGMGEALAGIVDNANTVFWNPGGIVFLNELNFSFSFDPYTSLVSENDSKIQNFSLITQYKKSFKIGLNAKYFNFYFKDRNNIALSRSFDSGIALGYRRNNLGLGINVKFLSSAQGYIETKGLPSAIDIGILYSKNSVFKNVHQLNYNLGISLLNLSKGIKYKLWNSEYKEGLPTNLRLGYATTFQLHKNTRKFTLLSITHNFEYSHILNADRNYELPYKSLGLGIETTIFEILSLRTGYFYQKGGKEPLNKDILYNGMTYGIGINLPVYYFCKSLPLLIIYDYAQFPWDPNSNAKQYRFFKIHSINFKIKI